MLVWISCKCYSQFIEESDLVHFVFKNDVERQGVYAKKGKSRNRENLVTAPIKHVRFCLSTLHKHGRP